MRLTPRPCPLQPGAVTPQPAGRHRRVPVPRWLLVGALAVLMLVAPVATAYAETTTVLALAGSLTDVLNNIRTWVMGILATLATVFVTIGGLRYVMAGGDPGEIAKAKTAFTSAGIGYGLAALAPLVVTILQGIVGA
jgi:Type IV secretion system pilin